MNKKENEESPATLVAIAVAARKAGYLDVEKDARRKLEERYGLKINFSKARAADVEKGVVHDK